MASSASPAVGRALDILTHLAGQTGAVGASAIARDLGLPHVLLRGAIERHNAFSDDPVMVRGGC